MPRSPEDDPTDPVRYVVIQRPPRGEARLLPPLLVLLLASALIVYRTLSPDWHWDRPPAEVVTAPPSTPKVVPAQPTPTPVVPPLAEAKPTEPPPTPAEPTPTPDQTPPPIVVAAEPSKPEPKVRPEPPPDAIAHAALDDIRQEANRRRAEREAAERVQEQEAARLTEQQQLADQERAVRRRYHAPLDALRADNHRQFDALIREHQREQQVQMREMSRLQQELFQEIERAARSGSPAPTFPGVPTLRGFSYAAPPGRIVRYQFRWETPPARP